MLGPPLVGIDLVEPGRIADRVGRTPKLADELFTAAEREYCEACADPAEHFAARFAAKEAVVKALGIDGFEPKEIEVLKGGAEVGLKLHGEVLARAEALGVEVSISMSHIASLAGAVAVARPLGDIGLA